MYLLSSVFTTAVVPLAIEVYTQLNTRNVYWSEEHVQEVKQYNFF